MRNYLLGAAGTYLAALVALQSARSQSSPASPSTVLPRTPALAQLRQNRDYLILIDAYDLVKEVSRLVGFSGNYGHIEAVRNGKVYGCRPPQCSRISLSELELMFSGSPFEVREVEHAGDSDQAVRWFTQQLEGKTYDLLYRNCTDAVVGMYETSGDRTRRLFPVEVESTYAGNAPLRKFMKQRGIAKPNRPGIFFPDQFTSIGKLVAKGRFNQR